MYLSAFVRRASRDCLSIDRDYHYDANMSHFEDVAVQETGDDAEIHFSSTCRILSIGQAALDPGAGA